MASVPHEFVTVDMRHLKVALIERSRTARVSVSSLVRAFVAIGLGLPSEGSSTDSQALLPRTKIVKLSIRMPAADARRIADGARHAGLSRAAYLAELLAGVPEGPSSATRSEQLALLAFSNAELSTLSRNLRHLVLLLNRGSGEAAKEYTRMLNSIAGDVRRHLSLSSALLTEVRSRRLSATTLRRSPPGIGKEGHG
jgi:hypothetical protein